MALRDGIIDEIFSVAKHWVPCKWVHPVMGLLVLVSVVSCASGLTGRPTDQDSSGQIVLAPGDSHRIPGTDFIISFEAVVEDSRCPTGVTCIWEGDATIRIRIDSRNAPPATYTLHTNESFGREIVHGDIRVRLVDVKPYPAGDTKPRPDEYRVTLLIQRK